MSQPVPQDLAFRLKVDLLLSLEVEDGEDIDLTAITPALQIQTDDGQTILKTYTSGSGLTIASATLMYARFATDATELGVGQYRYQVRDTASSVRDVIAEGRLEISY